MTQVISNSGTKRKCLKCKKEKVLSEFFFDTRSGTYQNICLECHKEYHHNYYELRKIKNQDKAILIDPSSKKICIRCGIEKPITDFSFDKASGKVVNTCKACKVVMSRIHYEKNKEKKLLYATKYRDQHRDEIDEYQRNYRIKNANKRREYSRQYEKAHYDEIKPKRKKYRLEHIEEFRRRDREYARTHKEQIAERYKKWANDHSEQLAEYNRLYREKNAQRISEQRKKKDRENRPRIREYIKNKRANDPLFKLSTNVRGLIRISLKNRGYSKKTATYEILGCDYETLMKHLRQTWLENYGYEWAGEDYHIDHIIPLATAKDEKEVIDLCYYKNLQMLKPHDNLVKNKKLGWKLSNK